MHFVDHNTPHFHAEYGDYVAEYDIQTLKIIAGKLPGRANALVWASIHREGANEKLGKDTNSRKTG